MVTVLTTSPTFARAGDLAAQIEHRGWRLVRCLDGGLDQHLGQADFLVAGLPAVTDASLAKAPHLRGVLKHGVGLDSIDIPAATARRIPVLNTPGANAIAVAELALAAIFALSRHVTTAHASIVAGGWERKIGREVQGAVLGIIGLGNIGRVLAVKARALGMRVVASDPNADAVFAGEHQIALAMLDEVLAQADFVSLHVFGGKDNAALIGARELALMHPDACLLNLARGEIVDLDALNAALQAGRLGGAAIDAYTVEPPDRGHPIFARPDVIFSPHSGADTAGSLLRMGQMVIDDIAALLGGGQPLRVVNPDVFAASA